VNSQALCVLISLGIVNTCFVPFLHAVANVVMNKSSSNRKVLVLQRCSAGKCSLIS
jgi:hypothetical protein